MVSSVRSRPDHYETLGITASASEEEIAEAFARKMSALRWHPVGAKAPVCIAYETLRDPAKRRAYDRSLGLIPKSAPRQWGFAMAPQRWAFIAAAPTPGFAAPPPEPHVTVAPEPVERRIEEMMAARIERDERLADADDRERAWKRPVLAVGGFVLAAGLIGTIAGMSVKDDAASAQPEPVAAVARPAAKPQPAAAAAPAAPEAAWLDEQPDQPVRARAKHRSSRPHRTAWAHRQIREAKAEPSEAANVAADPLAPQPAVADLPSVSH